MIATEETDEANLLQNLILDGLCLFLGGMIGARAAYEGRIRGKALTGNANASTLSIFDNGWLDNESSKAKNFYLQMLTTFTEKNDAFQKWEIKNTKKTSGLGATKAAGINQHAYNAAASGKSWDAIELDHQTGAISDEEFEYIKRDWAEAHNSITSIKCEYEPFAMIAKKVSGQFGNFISTMTRAGAGIANIPTGKNGIFGKPYYSQEDIDNEKDPKKKEEMISTNEAWKAAGVDLARLKVGDVSLSTPTGKDEKGTVGDLIADSRVSTSSQEYIDGKLDVKEDIKLLAQRIEEQFNFANSLFSFPLLAFLTSAISSASACMSPLAMILTGFVIGGYSIKALASDKKIYFVSLLRLIVIPAAFALLLMALQTDDAIIRVALCATAMPLGLNTVVIPAAHGGDTVPGASMALISHLMSIVTIPIMFALLL